MAVQASTHPPDTPLPLPTRPQVVLRRGTHAAGVQLKQAGAPG